MGDDSRFVIPEECREFGEANCDERRRVAKRFVEKFVENIAPPKSHDTDGAWTHPSGRDLLTFVRWAASRGPEMHALEKASILLTSVGRKRKAGSVFFWRAKANGLR